MRRGKTSLKKLSTANGSVHQDARSKNKIQVQLNTGKNTFAGSSGIASFGKASSLQFKQCGEVTWVRRASELD